MASNSIYFIGNWKMFGIANSYKILDKINHFFQKDKKNNKKYKIIIAPPFTLLQKFKERYKDKKILISAQNCHNQDYYGAYTSSISPFMIKKIGVSHVILGHSEVRQSGENSSIIREKTLLAIKNNLKIILCIGENKKDRSRNITLRVLKKQILNVIKKRSSLKKILIAYEPIWSIGTGKVPTNNELKRNIIYLKKYLKKKFNTKYNTKFLYGGSVDKNTINDLKKIKELDGFLVGGASRSSKKFIDIIKNFYK